MSNAQNKYPGKLIVVEGLDGAGKSTQIHLLRQWLEQNGCRVYFTQWNSSQLVKSATSKAKKWELLTPTTFSLIHATDFADRYERRILPLLRGGFIVLADRYIYTALVRDSVRGVDRQWVTDLYRFAFKPDLTFYLSAPLEVSLQRILTGRVQLKHHEAGMDLKLSSKIEESFSIFQGRIREEYERIKGKYHFIEIDATRPIHIQQRELRDIIRSKIDLTGFGMKGEEA